MHNVHMFAYFVRSTYDPNKGMQSVKLESGQRWDEFEPGTTMVLVHPDLDFHTIAGINFLANKQVRMGRLSPGEKVTTPGVFILSYNYYSALELLRP